MNITLRVYCQTKACADADEAARPDENEGGYPEMKELTTWGADEGETSSEYHCEYCDRRVILSATTDKSRTP